MVKIFNIYDIAETSWMYQILQEHFELLKKHIDGINGVFEADNKTLRKDLCEFYKRWKGENSQFVTSLTKILYKSVLSRMATASWGSEVDFKNFTIKTDIHVENWRRDKEKLPYIYKGVWEYLVKYVNGGEDCVMDDNFFEEAISEAQAFHFDLYSLEFFSSEMMVACIELIEAHYNMEKIHPFNRTAI